MINTILFDMDGVLVDAADLHYEALNKALMINGHKMIGFNEHTHKYNGLPTRTKLEMLGIGDTQAAKIYKDKQFITKLLIDQKISVDKRVSDIVLQLYARSYRIGVVTNAIRETAIHMLSNSDLLKHVEFLVSNEDAESKPSPDGYIKAMIALGSNPKTTLVVEDTDKGEEAGVRAGAYVLRIDSFEDLSLDKIYNAIEEFSGN